MSRGSAFIPSALLISALLHLTPVAAFGAALTQAAERSDQSESACVHEATNPDAASEPLSAAERQVIENLRRQYARATDLIGEGKLEEGRHIYRQIFTDDVSIRVLQDGKVTRQSVGPDQWAQEVRQALLPYPHVQHLIGTQLVDEPSAVAAGPCRETRMSSYLQAWHDRPDDHVYIFIGTYYDKVRWLPDVGWKIYNMELREVSGAMIRH